MNPASEEALFDDLASVYSDAYKSVYNVRPRDIDMRTMTVEDLEKAIDDLTWQIQFDLETQSWQADLDAAMRDAETGAPDDEASRAALPNPADMEHLPKRSGMGRRFESKQILRRRIRKLVQEKYRLDLPAMTVPVEIAQLLSAAHKSIVEAQRLIAVAEQKAPSDDLADQLHFLHNEFLVKNTPTIEGLVDLLENEENIYENAKCGTRKKLIIKKRKN